MPSDTQTPSPSSTVERIREIIVGRHLDRLEQRVALLEQATPAQTYPGDARLDGVEARVEALQQHFHRLSDGMRFETDARENRHQEEIRRLADHIQKAIIAQHLAPDPTPKIEARLGNWLADWQNAAQQRAEQREQLLVTQLRDELLKLREWATGRLEDQRRAFPDRTEIDQRFTQISRAARALADAAEPLPFTGNLPPLP